MRRAILPYSVARGRRYGPCCATVTRCRQRLLCPLRLADSGVRRASLWSLLREQWRHAYHKVFLGTHTLRDASVEFVALFYNRPFLNVSVLRRVAARALGTSPAGLVVDVGGPLSHGAIVVREYGLPAVVHVKEATRLVRTGQTITTNGATGEVWVE